LLDAVEQELVLLFLYSGDRQLAEDLVDRLELAQLAQIFVCFLDHLLHHVVFCWQHVAVLLLDHLYTNTSNLYKLFISATNAILVRWPNYLYPNVYICPFRKFYSKNGTKATFMKNAERTTLTVPFDFV